MIELGLGIPDNLRFVPVDFEAGDLWREKLIANEFDADGPSVLASTGVSLYLTKEANMATLREVSTFAPGSTLAMTFMLPAELVDEEERAQYLIVQEKARAAGTPFLSFFEHVSRSDLIQRYFTGRSDGLRPSSGEEFLVAFT